MTTKTKVKTRTIAQRKAIAPTVQKMIKAGRLRAAIVDQLSDLRLLTLEAVAKVQLEGERTNKRRRTIVSAVTVWRELNDLREARGEKRIRHLSSLTRQLYTMPAVVHPVYSGFRVLDEATRRARARRQKQREKAGAWQRDFRTTQPKNGAVDLYIFAEDRARFRVEVELDGIPEKRMQDLLRLISRFGKDATAVKKGQHYIF